MMRFGEKISFSVILWFCLVWVEMLPGGVAQAGEVAVIRVQYRQAAELVPIVQSMLSAKGTVTVSQRTNSLVIVDTPEAIQRVNAYLDQFDRPVEQVRIHVRFHTQGAEQERTIEARGRVSNDELSVATGGKQKDGLDLSVEDRRRRQTGSSEAFVVAMSGSPAFIRSGQQIPYRQSSAFFRRYAPRDRTIAWQSAESGFEVTPTVVGDNVHLKIVPRIVYDDRQDAVIRFFGAQTELTVPIGQWVEIGGAANQENEVIKEILSRSQGGENSATSMSLMVERR
jgi:type II secretory pathway component GspD/PulD (secretin)